MREKYFKIAGLVLVLFLLLPGIPSTDTSLITFPGEFEEEQIPDIRGRIYPEALIGTKAVRGRRLGHYKREELGALLYHPEPRVRVRAARQIGHRGLIEFESNLIYVIENDPVREVRTVAIASLGLMRSEGAIGFLENLLSDASDNYLDIEKAIAATALGNIPNSSVELLAQEVESNPSATVRAGSVRGLKRKLPNPRALEAIEKAKIDPHPLVRFLAYYSP